MRTYDNPVPNANVLLAQISDTKMIENDRRAHVHQRVISDRNGVGVVHVSCATEANANPHHKGTGEKS